MGKKKKNKSWEMNNMGVLDDVEELVNQEDIKGEVGLEVDESEDLFELQRLSHEPADVEETVYELSDAARRFIVNYKEHWLSGLAAHLKANNTPLTGNEEYFKKWFSQYGLAVK